MKVDRFLKTNYENIITLNEQQTLHCAGVFSPALLDPKTAFQLKYALLTRVQPVPVNLATILEHVDT